MRKRTKVTKEMLQSIIDGGMTIEEVAERAGIKRYTVIQYLGNHKSESRCLAVRFDPCQWEAIVTLASAEKKTYTQTIRDLIQRGMEQRSAPEKGEVLL